MANTSKPKTTIILRDATGEVIYRGDTTREVNFVGIFTNEDPEHGLVMWAKYSKTHKGASYERRQAAEVLETKKRVKGELVATSKRFIFVGRPNPYTTRISEI